MSSAISMPRMNRFVSARFAADCPGAPGIVPARAGLVVRRLALGDTDRMDRRQIEHIETHRCDVRQTRFDIRERAVHAGVAGRARKQLVPAREARPLAIDFDDEWRLVLDDDVWVDTLLFQLLAAQQVDAHVLPRRFFLREIPAPCREVVDPRGHGELISAELAWREARRPPIVDERRHRHAIPAFSIRRAIEQHARDDVVTVGEHVRFDDHRLTDRTLGWKFAAVHLRREVLDDHPRLSHLAAVKRVSGSALRAAVV
jgi:hypothetical protein